MKRNFRNVGLQDNEMNMNLIRAFEKKNDIFVKLIYKFCSYEDQCDLSYRYVHPFFIRM